MRGGEIGREKGAYFTLLYVLLIAISFIFTFILFYFTYRSVAVFRKMTNRCRNRGDLGKQHEDQCSWTLLFWAVLMDTFILGCAY